jgi:hypothetical protein
MKGKVKYLISIFFVLTFYVYAIVEKAMRWTDYSPTSILRNNLILITIVLGVIYVLNKYLNKNDLRVFFQRREKFIVHLVLGLLLLSITYLINSIGRVSYYVWIPTPKDLPVHTALREILNDKLYTFILLGPFVWLSETFGVITRIFLLNNLWKINNAKFCNWASVIFVAILFGLLQIDKGLSDIINVFLIVLASNIFYLKYRNSVPLIIAPVLFTTIDLIAFWVYNF